MAWVFAAVVLVLAVYVPGFRKVLLVLGGAILVIAFFGALSSYNRSPPTPGRDEPIQAAPPPQAKVIPVEQIEVGELRSDFSRGHVQRVGLRIHNNSERETLASVDYRLLVDDCQGGSKEPASCATVSDDHGTIDLEVPAKQARDTSIYVHSGEAWSEVTILGRPRIKVIITAARAKGP